MKSPEILGTTGVLQAVLLQIWCQKILGLVTPPPHTTSILGPSLLLLALLVPSLQGKQFFVDTGTALYYAGGGTLLFN